MKRQGGVSHLPMATGAVCSPNGVRAISTPFTPVPKGPPAGRGGGDTRELTSQGHPRPGQTHRSCCGIPVSHAINSDLR